MAQSLYEASIPQFLQILPAMLGLMDKVESNCADKGIPVKDMLDTRLAPDMFPLANQFRYAALHSAGAVKALQDGVTGPTLTPAPDNIPELRAMVEDAITFLEVIDPAELNALQDKDVVFQYGERKMPFTGRDYLLSFAQPNFYFHTSMAYAILRAQGLDLGKADYLGRPRMKLG